MGKGKLKKPDYHHVFFNTALEQYYIFPGVSYDEAYRKLEDFCDEKDKELDDTYRVGYIDPDDYTYIGSVRGLREQLIPLLMKENYIPKL